MPTRAPWRRRLCLCRVRTDHRRNNRRDRGDWSPTFRLGPTMYWSPQILGRSFQKARNLMAISIVVTRMQDLASEFSQILCGGGVIPRTITAGGGDPSCTQHPSRPMAGRGNAPVLGPKPWSPQLFSHGCAPGTDIKSMQRRCVLGLRRTLSAKVMSDVSLMAGQQQLQQQ